MNELSLCPKDFNPHILFAFKQTKTNENTNEPLHEHEFLSITYVISGSVYYLINGEDYIASKGDVIIINSHSTHMHRVVGDEFVGFFLGITDFKRYHLPNNHFLSKNEKPVITLTQNETEFYECYRQILMLQTTKELGWKLLIKSLIMKQLVLLLKESIPHNPATICGYLIFDSYEKEAIIKNITYYIQNNYKNKITLDNLTKNSYLSPVYISKVFKEGTGQTPINYLINLRIDKAKEMINEGILSMKEIAIEVGYEDYYYFSKLFKKITGLSPSNYKKQLQYNSG